MKQEEADRKWECLRKNFKMMLQCPDAFPSIHLSFEDMHRSAYMLVLHNMGDFLYSGVVDMVREHLADLATIAAQNGTFDNEEGVEDPFHILQHLWKRHIKSMMFIRDILMYMERYYVVRNQKVPICVMGQICFRQSELCDITRIKLSKYVAPKFCALAYSCKGLDINLIACILSMMELFDLCKLRCLRSS